METTEALVQRTYSKKQILQASGVALCVALIVLITAILPAEYDIDPTGLGELTGIKNLSGSQETGEYQYFVSSPWPYETTKETITLRPREGLEYKVDISTGSILVFSWSADGAVYYDLHGEPTEEEGKAFLPYKSYEIDTQRQASGFLIPEFTGTHGWYWRNDSDQPVTIILDATGYYEVVGIKNSSSSRPTQ
jgi:hypothetical protein